MAANAESAGQPNRPAKRKLRNYLLDRRFQLKYTGMVVAVTVVVAGVLGYFAYDYSRGQTQALSIEMATQPELHPEAKGDIQSWAEAQDRKVLSAIVGGILVLALALGLTGIIVTHKVVGPAYKLRRVLSDVADGHLKVEGRLRRGDELQEVFDAYARMVDSLRARREDEIARLDEAIEKARDGGIDEDSLQQLRELRERMQAALE